METLSQPYTNMLEKVISWMTHTKLKSFKFIWPFSWFKIHRKNPTGGLGGGKWVKQVRLIYLELISRSSLLLAFLHSAPLSQSIVLPVHQLFCIEWAADALLPHIWSGRLCSASSCEYLCSASSCEYALARYPSTMDAPPFPSNNHSKP